MRLNRPMALTLSGGSSGPTYSAEATALFARMSVQPDATRKALYDDLISDYIAAGIWVLCDGIWVFAAHSSQAALLNLKGDAINCTATNGPTFATDRGYTGNGTNTEVTTNTLVNSLTHFTQNSAHLSAWSLTEVTEDKSIAGAAASANVLLSPRLIAGNLSFRVNDTVPLTAVVATPKGHNGINRSASNARQAYKDGSAVANDAQASTTRPASNLTFCRGSSFFSTNQVALGTVGASLSAGQWSAKDLAERTFLTAIGAL